MLEAALYDPLLCNILVIDCLGVRMGSGKFGGLFCRRFDFLLFETPHHFWFVMSTTARLFRRARPGYDIKSFSLRLVRKHTSQSSTSFRRVPGLGEETSSRAAQVKRPLDKAETSRRQTTTSERKAHPTNLDQSACFYQHGQRYDFFEYYLRRDFSRKPLKPTRSTSSFSSEPKTLPLEFSRDPLKILGNPSADSSLVRLCLQTFVVRVHREQGNTPEARELYKSNKVGVGYILSSGYEKQIY